MRAWRLTQNDPLALRLCADVRLGPVDYADDQTWELSLAGGDPLALRTTYGLRARDMRLFAAFHEGEAAINDPAGFTAPPVVNLFAVNRLQCAFSPLDGLQVRADYWAPDSHSVAGQWTITNNSPRARSVRIALNALLRPLEGGTIMSAARLGILHYLKGQTGNIAPIVILEEGLPDDSGAVLARTLDLAPGETQIVRWAQSARPTIEDGLTLCRSLLERDWSDDFAKINALAEAIPDIETGDPDWDAAFAFAYKAALQSYVGPTLHLPYPSFIFARNINKGYSPHGDGSDHSWQWDGQVATEAYVNLSQIAQCAPELAKGILHNYLAVQEPDGFIDWKPGLGGQRNRALCIPLLATLAWTIYEYTEDEDFIAEVYEGLKRFLLVWFKERFDRDQDGLPEWSHTIQSAFDDCPSFVRWQSWGQAADITLAEAPDLASYLYRECHALVDMAILLGKEEDTPPLIARAEMIRIAVEAMWSDKTNSYHYVDIETHESPAGYELGRSRGDFSQALNQKFPSPARVLVRVFGDGEATPPQVTIAIHGRGRRGRPRVEDIPARRVVWYRGIGSVTSEALYSEVEKVEVSGVLTGWDVIVTTVDYTRQDQTLLLPIWAGLAKGKRLDALIATITDPNRYWRSFGIPNCSALDPAYKPDNRDGSGGVWMMWNTMIGEGLADSGHCPEAAELIGRMMTAMIHTLKTEKAFREAYNCDTLEGLGERDYLWGVAPVHLFLRTLGVRIISPRKVWLVGHNPFPWSVVVRWRGVTVTKTDKITIVKFASGSEATVTGAEEQVVEDSLIAGEVNLPTPSSYRQ